MHTPITIANTADEQLFTHLAKVLETKLQAVFVKKLDGLDEQYWDFYVDNCRFTLHRQTYLGIILYASSIESTAHQTNDLAERIAKQLKEIVEKSK